MSGMEPDILLPFAFGVQLDGPKRDRYALFPHPDCTHVLTSWQSRLVWLGDFYIGATSLVVSTADYDVHRGTLESSLEHASPAGAVGISNPMGINTKYAQAYVQTGSLILSDYQLDFLNSVYLYVQS